MNLTITIKLTDNGFTATYIDQGQKVRRVRNTKAAAQALVLLIQPKAKTTPQLEEDLAKAIAHRDYIKALLIAKLINKRKARKKQIAAKKKPLISLASSFGIVSSGEAS